MANGRTRMVDIANKAGVSRTAVWRVLAGDPSLRVAPDTRQRIEQAARDLRYVSDIHARHLRRRTTSLIGILAGGLGKSYESAIFSALCRGLSEMNLQVLVGDSQGDAESAMRHAEVFRSYRTRAVITLHQSGRPAPAVIRRLIESQTECGPLICVCFQQRVHGAPTLTIDGPGIYAEALRLFRQDGCRSAIVASVRGPAFQRLKQTVSRLLRAEFGPHGQAVDVDTHDQQEMARQLVPSILERLQRGRVGVMTGVDTEAVYLIGQLRAAGVSVPEQVAVCGYGNFPAATFYSPSVTTFNVMGTTNAMAEKALELLRAYDRGEDVAPAEHAFRPPMIFRESFSPASAVTAEDAQLQTGRV